MEIHKRADVWQQAMKAGKRSQTRPVSFHGTNRCPGLFSSFLIHSLHTDDLLPYCAERPRHPGAVDSCHVRRHRWSGVFHLGLDHVNYYANSAFLLLQYLAHQIAMDIAAFILKSFLWPKYSGSAGHVLSPLQWRNTSDRTTACMCIFGPKHLF